MSGDETLIVESQLTLDLPVRIVVTGDTHLGPTRRTLPGQLAEAIRDSGVVVHTGDFNTFDVMEDIRSSTTLVAVSGNNDDRAIRATIPDRLILRAGSLRILVTHGHRERGTSARDSVRRAYAGRYDLVIYGHSHMPEWEQVGGTWFLNPGSPTNRRRAPRFSFAILEVDCHHTFKVDFCSFDRQVRTNPE